MKMTKSELRQMIRECLREELSATKPTENSLIASLDSAVKHKFNVLVHTHASRGRGVFAQLHAWADTQNIHLVRINCPSIDENDLNRIAEKAIPRTVLVLDEYDRARPATRAKLLSVVLEKSCGQMFSIALIGSSEANLPINAAESRQFDIECYLD
jgi:DNA-binding NtrC family response regulator